MIYAQAGESLQQVGGTCLDGWIVMQGERPTPEHVASEDGQWIIPEPLVPQVVTMRQARIALSRAGLLTQVAQLLEGMEGQAGDEARIEWEYSQEVNRSKPFVAQVGAGLNLTDDQIDDLFITAAGIA